MATAGRGYRGESSGVSSNNSRNHRGAHSEAGRSSNNGFEYAGRRQQDRFDADVLPSESASQAADSDYEDEDDDHYPEQMQQQQTMYQERENQYQQPVPQRRQNRQPQSYYERKTMHDRMHQMQERLKHSQTVQGIFDFLGGPLRSRYRHNKRARGNHYYDGPASAERKQAAHEFALARAAQKEEARQRRAEKIAIRKAHAEAEAARREEVAMQIPNTSNQPRRHPQDIHSQISSSPHGSSRIGSERMYQEDGISSMVSSAPGLRPGMRPKNQTTYLQPPIPQHVGRKQQRTPAKYDPRLGRYVDGSEVSSAVSGLSETSTALGFKDSSFRYEGSSIASSSQVSSSHSGSAGRSRLLPPRRGPGRVPMTGPSQASSIPAPVRQYGASRLAGNERRGPASALTSMTGSSASQGLVAPFSVSSRSSAAAPVRMQRKPGTSNVGSQSSHGSTSSHRSAANKQPANTFEYLRNNVEKIDGYGEIHLGKWLDDQEDRRGKQQGSYKPKIGGASTVSSAMSSRSGASSRR